MARMVELRPPVRSRGLRIALALLLPLVVIVPMLGLAAITLSLAQASYTFADGALIIDSGDLFSGARTLRLADISDAQVVVLSDGRRTAGTALPGLCAGRFSYPEHGAVWQVTDCGGRGVLLRSPSEPVPIVVSPPDPQAFLALLHNGADARIVFPPPNQGPLRLLGLIVAPLAILTIVGVSVLLLLGPSRMRYRGGEGFFEVHTLFSKTRWPTEGASAKAHTPSGLVRVAGTGAPGYFTGRFREGGKWARVYATELGRVVLFESGEVRVIVSPEDPVELLRALEEEGVSVDRSRS
ncbi:MAG: PH domain-containing protein [Minicystis sp.]